MTIDALLDLGALARDLIVAGWDAHPSGPGLISATYEHTTVMVSEDRHAWIVVGTSGDDLHRPHFVGFAIIDRHLTAAGGES